LSFLDGIMAWKKRKEGSYDRRVRELIWVEEAHPGDTRDRTQMGSAVKEIERE